jgi:carbon monoxide dehydrogenase subunit G
MRLENTFHVPAPIEEAWALLTDVPQVVPCMPGAELTEVVDETHWKAKVHVKLGPISLRFAADVARDSMVEATWTTVLSAKARELKGRGGAEATIESTLVPADGGTQVNIVTELALRGAVAQYGRGILADVSDQIVKQFGANLAAQLQNEPEAPAAAAPAAPTSGTAGAGAPASATATPARPARSAPPAQPVKPVGGLGIFLRALLAPVLRLFRRGRRDA